MLMTWSGILIYWAHEAYVPIPKSVVEFFGLNAHLAEGMGWHFLLMWPFVINGIVYCFYLIFSGEWREITPTKTSLK